MKCPHCDYEYKYKVENEDDDGCLGQFYQIYTRFDSILMTRDERHPERPKLAHVCGCPSCKKLFMIEV